MRHARWLRQAIRIAGISALLLSLLTSSGLPLLSQAPSEPGDQVDLLYLPFASVDTAVGIEQVDADQPDPHGSADAVDVSLAEQKRLSDPMVGRISAEVQAAASGPPNEVGRWSDVIDMGVVPIFVALLPNGNVLMWDTDPNGGYDDTRVRLWNPNSGSVSNVDLDGYSVFCAGFTHLSDGRLFLAGGNIDDDQTGIPQTHFFDYRNNSWTQGPNMAENRWYPSVAALPNEELFIMGGILDRGDLHEVYETSNTIRSLTSARLAHNQNYPFIQTAPDGRVLYAGPTTTMRMLNTSGSGSWQSYGNRDTTNRNYGSYAMYDIGKVLVAGGSTPARNSARIIDVNDGSPSATSTTSMIKERRQHNLTVLPDGTVLATGGLFGTAGLVDMDRGVYAAEVWDPDTGAWTELANMEITRQYHSTALLLADGRVMVGGGGVCGDCNAAGYFEDNIEIFEPPYLFDSSGNRADRPNISSVASEIGYGNGFAINSPDASSIDKIGLVKLGAPTHSQNMGQRYIPLDYSRSGNTLTAAAPANANIAPPGTYMLFIIDDNGVPSVAKFVNVNANDLDPDPDGSVIQVWAKGQEGAERMELRIDNDVVKVWTVRTSMDFYEHVHSDTVRANQISVHFTNDEYDAESGYDHNLTVDKMILDGTTYESEAATVEAKGVGTPNGCNVVGFFEKELLYCDGYFKYNAGDGDGGDDGGGGDDEDGSTIQVFAKGDEGDEVIQLRIDGSTVKSWTLSQAMATYTHEHSSDVNANQVAVHFINDAANANKTYDLNVTIDKIVLDGTTHQTEAPSVEGKGFWNGSNCSQVSNYQQERLHCNGYYAY